MSLVRKVLQCILLIYRARLHGHGPVMSASISIGWTSEAAVMLKANFSDAEQTKIVPCQMTVLVGLLWGWPMDGVLRMSSYLSISLQADSSYRRFQIVMDWRLSTYNDIKLYRLSIHALPWCFVVSISLIVLSKLCFSFRIKSAENANEVRFLLCSIPYCWCTRTNYKAGIVV